MGLLESALPECSNRHDVSTKQRVRALRDALDLTQEQLAERSGGLINQGTLAKVETGQNQLTGGKARSGLARAFGLSLDAFEAYLSGETDMATVLRRRGDATARPELHVEREPEHIPADDEVPLETAALRVMDRDRHTLRDLDAVRATIHAAPRKETLGADLGETALRLLEAARGLRLAGEAATPTAILWRAAVGRHQRDTDLVDELDAAEDAEVDAALRAKGLVPQQGRAQLEADRDAMVAREKKGRRGA